MMTEQQVRDLIIKRLNIVDGQCNSSYLDYNDGVFRGLIWVLTGEDPGTYLLRNLSDLLTKAGIAHRIVQEDGERMVELLGG